MIFAAIKSINIIKSHVRKKESHEHLKSNATFKYTQKYQFTHKNLKNLAQNSLL